MQLNRTKSGSAYHTPPPDAATMRTIIATILAVITATVLISLHTPPEQANHAEIHAEPTKEHSLSTATAVPEPTISAEQKVVAEKPVEPPKPAPWAVTSSPHGRVAVDDINKALAHLQQRWLSKEGAAYLVGNFIGESYLTPCGQYGDGGRAHGFGQWHPTRRYDMPCGFIEQLDWALDVEMLRDSTAGGYGNPVDALKGSDIGLIKLRLQQWERWGVEGGRWQYAAAVYSQL